MTKKARTLRMPWRVDHWADWMGDGGTWISIARFAVQSDALQFAQETPYMCRRVVNGRRVVATYSGRYIPPGDAAGDRAKGEGTGAPEH